MAKSEKTDAYVCSGTAQRRPLVSPCEKIPGSRWNFFATARDPEETRMNRDESKGKAEKAISGPAVRPAGRTSHQRSQLFSQDLSHGILG